MFLIRDVEHRNSAAPNVPRLGDELVLVVVQGFRRHVELRSDFAGPSCRFEGVFIESLFFNFLLILVNEKSLSCDVKVADDQSTTFCPEQI